MRRFCHRYQHRCAATSLILMIEGELAANSAVLPLRKHTTQDEMRQTLAVDRHAWRQSALPEKVRHDQRPRTPAFVSSFLVADTD